MTELDSTLILVLRRERLREEAGGNGDGVEGCIEGTLRRIKGKRESASLEIQL